jgi:hypothetical protein
MAASRGGLEVRIDTAEYILRCSLRPQETKVFKFGVYLAVPIMLTFTFVGVPENMQRVIANVRPPCS